MHSVKTTVIRVRLGQAFGALLKQPYHLTAQQQYVSFHQCLRTDQAVPAGFFYNLFIN